MFTLFNNTKQISIDHYLSMKQETMTQDEIDKLMLNISMGEIDDPFNSVFHSPLNTEDCKHKYNAVVAAIARYDHALMNGSIEEAREARRNLHLAAFNNWLLRHDMTRDEYCNLINRELVKRGCPPRF